MIELAIAAINRYEEDRVDITDDGIVVYYPEITIVSETKSIKPHVMKDLYFIITKYRDIGLTRRTFTSVEFQYGYVFSHAQSYGSKNVLNKYEWLCSGDNDTPMSIFRNNIGANYDLDGDEADLFWLQVEKYLSFESISGTPYRYLRELVDKSAIQKDDENESYNIANKTIKEIYNNIIQKDLKFNYRNNTVIVDRDRLLELISNDDIYKQNWNSSDMQYYYKDGDYYILKNGKVYSESEIKSYNTGYPFTFKNKSVPLSIINTANVAYNTAVPAFVFYGILNQINTSINKYQQCYNKQELVPYTK